MGDRANQRLTETAKAPKDSHHEWRTDRLVYRDGRPRSDNGDSSNSTLRAAFTAAPPSLAWWLLLRTRSCHAHFPRGAVR